MAHFRQREYISALIAGTFGKLGKLREWLIVSVSVPNAEEAHRMKKTEKAFLGIE